MGIMSYTIELVLGDCRILRRKCHIARLLLRLGMMY